MKVKTFKRKLSPMERLSLLKTGIKILAQNYVPCYSKNKQEWQLNRLTLREKIDCFMAILETAIIGTVEVLNVENESYEVEDQNGLRRLLVG